MNGTEKSLWAQLPSSFAETITALENSIVAIDSGGRSTSSGVVWRPGVIVTTHHGFRLREDLKIICNGEPLSAHFIGNDATTDIAVLGVDSNNLIPVQSASGLVTRAGEVVLSVGRSRLGDISASCGIIARTGSPWRSWRGGAIDQLIRPDIQLYVGQAGSALVNEQRQVLGMNSLALMAGLVVRFAHPGLAPFVVKYGGSMLWALMIYWTASTVLLKWRIPTAVLFAGTLGTTIEPGKLYHSPVLDSFRLTLPGIVLFGCFFSVSDILAYWLAVSIGAVVDWRLRPRIQSRSSTYSGSKSRWPGHFSRPPRNAHDMP